MWECQVKARDAENIPPNMRIHSGDPIETFTRLSTHQRYNVTIMPIAATIHHSQVLVQLFKFEASMRQLAIPFGEKNSVPGAYENSNLNNEFKPFIPVRMVDDKTIPAADVMNPRNIFQFC